MAYRNGIYVAFNGCGTTDPTQSDIKYYNLLKAWCKNESHNFTFSNSHAKTYRVLDTSSEVTLKNRLQERMNNSKSMLLLVTQNSNQNRGLLNWEIEKCVLSYDLPIIIAYTMCYARLSDISPYYQYLPSRLKELIESNQVKTISTPFRQEILLKAIQTFSFNSKPLYTQTVFSSSVYDKFGI